MSDEIESVKKELSSGRRLRAAINRGNSVLVQVDPDTDRPGGVTVDLAGQLAQRLGVDLDLVEFNGAREVFEALESDGWDIAFLAIDPARAEKISFTRPYGIIEGNYVVPKSSDIGFSSDVDKAGQRVAVIKGSAYDLFLSRTLVHAELVRFGTQDAAFGSLADGVDAVAGIKHALLEEMKSRPGLRIVEPPFMEIRQAMGTPQGRPHLAAYLGRFIEEMKTSGFVSASLQRSGQHGNVVVPSSTD